MVAQTATTNRPDSHRLSPAVVRLWHALTITTAVMLLLLALWLLARRLGGQLQQPLGTLTLLVVALMLLSLASSLRIVWHHTGPHLSHWRSPSTLVWIFPSVVLLLIAVSLSISGTGTYRLLLFWSMLLAGEGAWSWFAWQQLRQTRVQPSRREPATRAASSLERSTTENAANDDEMELDECDEQLPAEVSQQITRTYAEDDNDTVSGVLRARLAPSERSQSLHVAFCPPMLRPPRVTVVQLSGSRARIKAADAQPFGIRFDLRLATASQEAQEVLIHFEARCAKPASTGLGGIQA